MGRRVEIGLIFIPKDRLDTAIVTAYTCISLYNFYYFAMNYGSVSVQTNLLSGKNEEDHTD